MLARTVQCSFSLSLWRTVSASTSAFSCFVNLILQLFIFFCCCAPLSHKGKMQPSEEKSERARDRERETFLPQSTRFCFEIVHFRKIKKIFHKYKRLVRHRQAQFSFWSGAAARFALSLGRFISSPVVVLSPYAIINGYVSKFTARICLCFMLMMNATENQNRLHFYIRFSFSRSPFSAYCAANGNGQS